jgi:malate synthase
MPSRPFEIRGNLESSYPDVFTPEALAALTALAPLDADRKAIMKARIARRGARTRDRRRIAFLDPQSVIPRTQITVQDARGRQVHWQRDPQRPQASVDSGHRPGSEARRDG